MERRKKVDSYIPAQIVDILRAVEVAKGEDKTAAQAISENTYYRWRRQYGEMDRDEVKRFREAQEGERASQEARQSSSMSEARPLAESRGVAC
mgnify:CR=1 FL=1